MPHEDDKLNLDKILKTLARTAEISQQAQQRLRSNQPYYNENAADECLHIIDTVLANGCPMLWPAQGISENTLYLKWRQGCQWIRQFKPELVEKLELIHASRIPKHGMRFSPIENPTKVGLFIEQDWRPDLLRFIDEAEHRDKFERVGIPLSNEDLRWLAAQLENVGHLFMTDISPKKGKILLIRYDPARDSQIANNKTGKSF